MRERTREKHNKPMTLQYLKQIINSRNIRAVKEKPSLFASNDRHALCLKTLITRRRRNVRLRREMPWACCASTDITPECGNAATWNRTANITWYEAATSTPGWSTIIIRLEFHKCALISFIFDNERSATILRIALCVANLQHLLKSNRRLVRGLQLLHLLKNNVHIVETSVAFHRAATRQLLACLAHHEAD